jgi:carboxypeptidase C (cathepsin A)
MNSDSSEFVATHNLSQAFANNPDLQVFVASGYYDLACPMGTVEYERTRLDPESNGRDRMSLHHYESGHMVYINPQVMHRLKQDLSEFFTLSRAGVLQTPQR